MEVRAQLRFLRMSPRKVRLVVDLIRGLGVEEAEYQLQFLNKAAARPVLKLLQSAIANAENNNKLAKDNLYIKRIMVDQGPTLKRWRPRAFGRAAEIRKRSSHVTVILDELTPAKKAAAKKTAEKKSTAAKKDDRPVVDYQDIKQAAKGKGEETSEEEQQQQKKSTKGFRGLKDKFTRRLGER
jgi:large subunit ribosomal protein L22